ncbi:hypothetical protein [Paenibacillus sp. SN-8-1]
MDVFLKCIGLATVFVGMGFLFALPIHGFHFVTIHKHYHGKKEDAN